MPRLIFKNADGSQCVVDAPIGSSLMQVALNNGLEGVLGDCGGACQCATCHVYVHEPDATSLPPMDAMEDDMLGCVAAPRWPDSRLGCCVKVAAEHEGMVVEFPATQG